MTNPPSFFPKDLAMRAKLPFFPPRKLEHTTEMMAMETGHEGQLLSSTSPALPTDNRPRSRSTSTGFEVAMQRQHQYHRCHMLLKSLRHGVPADLPNQAFDGISTRPRMGVNATESQRL